MNMQNKNISEISTTNLAKLGISCLENAVLIALVDANNQGQTSLKESEIRKQLGVNEVCGSDRIIFTILENLQGKGIAEDIGGAQWQILKMEENK